VCGFFKGRPAFRDGDIVGSHKVRQFIYGDAAVPAAGDAIAVEKTLVEPLGNGARCNVTDIGHFAGCQNVISFCHNFSDLQTARRPSLVICHCEAGEAGRGNLKLVPAQAGIENLSLRLRSGQALSTAEGVNNQLVRFYIAAMGKRIRTPPPYTRLGPGSGL